MSAPGTVVIDVQHFDEGYVTMVATVEVTPEYFREHGAAIQEYSDRLLKLYFPSGKLESRLFRAPRKFVNSALIIMKVRL